MPFREFDIVVYGATGYTGQLICEWLAEHSGGAKWAAAGRNEQKLQQVLQGIGRSQIPIIVADSKDEGQIEALVKRTQCVIAAAGPFSQYGRSMVKACADNGVHYFDVTGEPWFANDCIQQHAKAALQHRAIIVNCAGVDSTPSDIGAYLAARAIGSGKLGKTSTIYRLNEGVSGGTFQTMVSFAEQPSKIVKALLTNPYILSPKRGKQKKNVRPWATKVGGLWGGFYPMALVNQLIVQRTWGILETEPKSAKKEPFTYGPNFEYVEAMNTPGGPIMTFLLTLFIVIGTLFMAIPGVAPMIGRIGPQSGAGLAKEKLDTRKVLVITEAKSADGDMTVIVKQKAKTSGYKLTAIFAVEAALSVVKESDRLPLTARAGGPLTTMTACGDVLIERLKKTGYYEVDINVDEGKKQK